MNQLFEISDDASFLGLINTDLYDSFIDEDWEFEDVEMRIIRESQKGHLLFWGTSVPNLWTVRICDQATANHAFKTFRGKIKVSNSKLYLINYESITLAAQFEDETLPDSDLAALHVKLENGIYNVDVRQLFNPNQDLIEDEMLGFEIILQKSTEKPSPLLNSFDELIWSNY
ncbi:MULTISPECIES: hypothetical protein [unclassified Aureispira]|uniref:hypothetical protein n=1 Tax=unclassified Aureispira TaxID=2649989 RepID=UPI00069820A7|nr:MULTISPECIES: hypothetical protein [unclassified Aureispira]WMX15932.1 hypothetical protein QP953_06095 [Aureispira sp. CCB-E]